jgi:hypothetical protein
MSEVSSEFGGLFLIRPLHCKKERKKPEKLNPHLVSVSGQSEEKQTRTRTLAKRVESKYGQGKCPYFFHKISSVFTSPTRIITPILGRAVQWSTSIIAAWCMAER